MVPAGNWNVTKWSTLAGDLGGKMNLMIFRKTATPGSYQVVGSSQVKSLNPSTMNTFSLATPIAVQGGDLVGLWSDGISQCAVRSTSHYVPYDLSIGAPPAAATTVTPALGPYGMDLNISATLTAAALDAWVGLKNSDDQGTRFDLQAELKRGTTVLATALERCVTGVTRNPSVAKEVFADWDTSVAINAGDTIVVSTRIGTNSDGTKCGSGHSSAAGLRLYYDSTSRPSSGVGQFLHSNGIFNSTAPTGTTAATSDSPAVTFAGGNLFQTIGTWTAQ